MSPRREALGALALFFAVSGCAVSPLEFEGKTCWPDSLCPAPFTCLTDSTDGGPGTCVRNACDFEGQVCSIGVGGCRSTGVVTCHPAPGQYARRADVESCAAVPKDAGPETCDGKDNDCDGVVDDHLTDQTACERQQGVCSGKVHACTDAGYETPCGPLSYGADYEDVETRCDGLDNDCDGRADISRLVLVVPGALGFSWVRSGADLAAVYVTAPAGIGDQLSYQRFDQKLAPRMSPAVLAGGQLITSPGISSLDGGRVAVAWVQTAVGSQTVQIAEVAPDGDAGPWLGPTPVEAGAGYPKFAVDPASETALLVWIDSSQRLRTLVSAKGTTSLPPAPADGGDNVSSADVAALNVAGPVSSGAPVFIVGLTGYNSGNFTEFRGYDLALAGDAGTRSTSGAVGPAGVVRVAPVGAIHATVGTGGGASYLPLPLVMQFGTPLDVTIGSDPDLLVVDASHSVAAGTSFLGSGVSGCSIVSGTPGTPYPLAPQGYTSAQLAAGTPELASVAVSADGGVFAENFCVK